MSRMLFLFAVVFFVSACTTSPTSQEPEKYDYALVIHGGAGNFNFQGLEKERQAAYTSALDSALSIGEAVLKNGGSSEDAVVAVISFMEDNPLFNAGKGAVFTHEGTNELDASIMRGNDLQAGAVAGVKTVKNPIKAARVVMEKSEHVVLAGAGADSFAAEQGLDIVDPSYFYTERSYRRLQQAISDEKHGTVGCVALDKQGNLCAGTSTGGMTNKRWGRVGDSPIIGAGTYANNATCGISGTGHGEFFIRYNVAHDISALMAYKGMNIQQAAEEVVMKKLVRAGGEGGVIGLDNLGHAALVFNTTGMFRGYLNSSGEREVKLFKE